MPNRNETTVADLIANLVTEYELTDNYSADEEHWYLLRGNVSLSNGRICQLQIRVMPGLPGDRRFID